MNGTGSKKRENRKGMYDLKQQQCGRGKKRKEGRGPKIVVVIDRSFVYRAFGLATFRSRNGIKNESITDGPLQGEPTSSVRRI